MSYPRPTASTVFGSPIVFSQPFYFDPSKGNLLFDITKVGNGRLGYNVDAVRNTTDLSSCVARVGSLESTGGVLSLALIMEFTYVQVPEPSVLALVGIGILGGAFLLRRQSRSVHFPTAVSAPKR